MNIYEFFETKLEECNDEKAKLREQIVELIPRVMSALYRWAIVTKLPDEVYDGMATYIKNYDFPKELIKLKFFQDKLFVDFFDDENTKINLADPLKSRSYKKFKEITGYDVGISIFPSNPKHVEFVFFGEKTWIKQVIIEYLTEKFSDNISVNYCVDDYEDYCDSDYVISVSTPEWNAPENQ